MNQIALFTLVGLGLAAAVAAVVSAIVSRRDRNAARLEADAQRRKALRNAVAAGTHDEEGHPLCRVEGCADRATRFALRAAREDGLLAWLRERLGAPVRYRVVEDVWTDERGRCEAHHEVARFEFRAWLLAFESARLEAVRDAEVELARFEKVGLDERVNARINAHEREAKRKPNLVAIAGGAGS